MDVSGMRGEPRTLPCSNTSSKGRDGTRVESGACMGARLVVAGGGLPQSYSWGKLRCPYLASSRLRPSWHEADAGRAPCSPGVTATRVASLVFK